MAIKTMENQNRHVDWRKYLIAFLITGAIFGTALYTNNYLNNKRMYEIKQIQDAISINILSSETEFSLLSDVTCTDGSDITLAHELNEIATRISYGENNINSNKGEIENLKKYYSLLQIKDYLLSKKVAEKCKQKMVIAMYFYGNGCDECIKQGFIVDALRKKYPELKIYSFDGSLGLSALSSFMKTLKVDTYPTLIIGGKKYGPFTTLEEMEKTVPEIKTLQTELESKEKAATTTKK